MLALTEKQALIQALGQVVFDEVKAAITPLQNRVVQLEKTIGDLAITTKDDVLGEAGRDENPPQFDVEFLRQFVAGALDAYAQAHPVRDGKDGKDGKDADIPWDHLNDMLSEQINTKIDALPKPRDGVDGAPGKDGKNGLDGADGKSLCLDDVRTCIADLVAEAVSVLPVPNHPVAGLIDRAGHLHFTYSDGSTRDMGQVVGRDGKDGKDGEPGAKGEPGTNGRDGIDGLGIEQIEYDGERTFRLANEKIDRSFTVPFPIYRGLWKPGSYLRGDEVTSNGSQFIAMHDTDKEPETMGSGWRLACKRGQNGRNADSRQTNKG